LIWDEQGPTAVEYAVMMGMILLVVIGAVATVGANTNDMWVRIMNNLTTYAFGN
jgi:pilus assembly protein Flp/PilA